jgi:hypothetical protein
LTGLTNGYTYYLAVSAYDFGLREGIMSDIISGTPVFLSSPKIVPSPSYLEGFSIASTSKLVMLSNTGNADLVIGRTSFTGESAGDFAQVNACNTITP